MILHCTPPYAQDVPNAALGYLKGFLQAKGISIKNVYWNLVLSREITDFQKKLETYTGIESESSIDAVTVYIWKHLTTPTGKKTPLDLLFSSIFSHDQLSEEVHSVKDKIDWYILENNLHKGSLAGFTSKTYQWLMNSYIIGRLKEMNPDITIVVGGITNEEQGRTFMKVFSHADYAIYGGGEYPLSYLARAIEEGTDIAHVPNLIYRDGTHIFSTGKFTEPPPLDDYPFADHSDYFETFQQFISAPLNVSIPIWGSRSCPWNKCRFCVLNEEYTYCARSPENIVAEIEYQSEKYDCDTFVFVDTEVPGNKKRFRTLLTSLVEASANRKKPFHLAVAVSPVFIDSETAQYMRAVSFSPIEAGFEAVTDSLLEKMRKRHRFAHNIQALKMGNHYGLAIEGLNIIRGIPTETKDDVLESCENLKFLRFLLNRYKFRLTLLGLYKGSPFFKEMSEEKRRALKYDRIWEEIAPLNIIAQSDRFEFFGFPPERSDHFPLWNDFAAIMESYKQQNRSYTWTEYKDGSFIEEKGPEVYRYVLDRDETDILIFCDSIRTFSEVRQQVPHLREDTLREILSSLKECGLLYYDNGINTIISVVEASRRICTF